MTSSTKSLNSDHSFEQNGYQTSSYFGSIAFCQVFDCMDGWSSILGRNKPDNCETQQQHHGRKGHKDRPDSSSAQRIDPTLFRNPLAEKMVEDAVERSKYNTKGQRHVMKSPPKRNQKDHHDKNDDLLDQRIALAARKKRQRQQAVQPHQKPAIISYSRRQHRLLQQQVAQQEHKDAQQKAFHPSPLLKFYSQRKKKERPHTPIPVPGLSRLNPKVSTKQKRIVPKRRPLSSSLLKRNDDSKRQSPPTTYCPPVSTPLVPIGEQKAMKEKKPNMLPMRRGAKVIPFQPDAY